MEGKQTMEDRDLLEVALAIQNIALLSNDETLKKIKPKLNRIEEIVLKWQKQFKDIKSLQAELEEIKSEIEKHNIADFIAVQSVLDILDNHISELKGDKDNDL